MRIESLFRSRAKIIIMIVDLIVQSLSLPALAKRFERITSQRLVAVLVDLHFDPLQFAYLKNRIARLY